MVKFNDKICVDAVAQSKIANNGFWKFNTIMYMSAFLCINFMTIAIILKNVLPLELGDFYEKKSLTIKREALMYFIIPAFLANYFILFFNNRYEKLLEKYEAHNGKYILRYIIFSILLFFICVFVF